MIIIKVQLHRARGWRNVAFVCSRCSAAGEIRNSNQLTGFSSLLLKNIYTFRLFVSFSFDFYFRRCLILSFAHFRCYLSSL